MEYLWILAPLILIIILISIMGNKKSKGTSQNKKNTQSQMLEYKLRPFLMTKNESAFYNTLLPIARTKNLTVFTKVRLADLIEPKTKENWQTAFNKIKSKHIDFVLCDPTSSRPLIAIELDDSSHQNEDRSHRDMFVDRALSSAGLPILHTLNANGISKKIDESIKSKTTPAKS